MPLRPALALLLLLFIGSPVSRAADLVPPFLPAPIAPGGFVLPLYAPDSTKLNRARLGEAERTNPHADGKGDRVQSVLNIHNPSIEVHLAQGRAANGAAVIVAPGGGHKILWVGPEGGDFATFFANYGISTIILRNRLRIDGYEPRTDAVSDALQAIRLVRSRAAEWKIDPAKIGIMGLSAGAELAAATALEFAATTPHAATVAGDPLAAVSARPDFVALVYPGPTAFNRAPAPAIPADVPPTFLMCPGSGDRVHALWATEYFTAMLKAGVPNLEMHIYGRGGHGGGLKDRDGIPLGTWQLRYIEWFRDLGFLGKPGVETKAAQEVAAFVRKPTQPSK